MAGITIWLAVGVAVKVVGVALRAASAVGVAIREELFEFPALIEQDVKTKIRKKVGNIFMASLIVVERCVSNYYFDLNQNTNYFIPVSKIHGPSMVLLKNFQAEFLASTSLNAAGFATMI